jgi:hypothetical protein
MARTNPHTPRVGAIVAPIEGTKIWSGTSLTFAFATNADAAETLKLDSQGLLMRSILKPITEMRF